MAIYAHDRDIDYVDLFASPEKYPSISLLDDCQTIEQLLDVHAKHPSTLPPILSSTGNSDPAVAEIVVFDTCQCPRDRPRLLCWIRVPHLGLRDLQIVV